jgi:cytoskeleton protein RodZ
MQKRPLDAAKVGRMRLPGDKKSSAPEPNTAVGASPRGGASVGDLLRAERERRGWQIVDIARQLKIRRLMLDAIETGRHHDLPRGAYAAGFVRAYADFLELDSAELVRRFRTESGGLEERAELAFPLPINETRLPGSLVVASALLAAVLSYGGWYYYTLDNRTPAQRITAVPETLAARVPAPEPLPPRAPALSPGEARAGALPQPQPALVLEPATPLPPAAFVPTPAPTASQMAALPPSLAPAPVAPAAVVEGPRSFGESHEGRIVIRATSDSWTQIRDAAGNVVFSRILRPGESYNPPDREGLNLWTGNAGGLDIRVDGRLVPAIGRVGFVQRGVPLDPVRLIAGTAAPAEVTVPARPAAAPASPGLPQAPAALTPDRAPVPDGSPG